MFDSVLSMPVDIHPAVQKEKPLIKFSGNLLNKYDRKCRKFKGYSTDRNE